MSIYDNISYIDTLADWWDNAEDAPASPGDRIIERHVCERDGDTYYTVGVHREGMRGLTGKSGTRILARAPKPAWHDAKAVIASTDYCERQVWERDTTYGNRWYGTAGEGAVTVTSDLRDVTPLIEAKVTDEMVLRALNASTELDLPHLTSFLRDDIEDMRCTLTAALGLEAE